MIDATEVMADEDVEKILLGTFNRPKTAKQLSDTYGIPIAICYKKIAKLERMGLLDFEEMVTSKGRTIRAYKANLDDAYVFFEGGKVKIRFKIALGLARDFRARFNAHLERSQIA